MKRIMILVVMTVATGLLAVPLVYAQSEKAAEPAQEKAKGKEMSADATVTAITRCTDVPNANRVTGDMCDYRCAAGIDKPVTVQDVIVEAVAARTDAESDAAHREVSGARHHGITMFAEDNSCQLIP